MSNDMTPNGYTYLQIVNATNQPLTQGQAGPGFFNKYQMANWFDFPAAPDPICPPASRMTYQLQFMQGVGDEDDGGDLQLNVGDPSQAAGAVVWVQARSTNQSGHYLQFKFQLPNTSLFIYGVTPNGGWDQAEADQVTWSANPGSTSEQYLVSNSTNSLAVVDLNQLFPNDSETANAYFIATVQGTLTQQQSQTLFSCLLYRSLRAEQGAPYVPYTTAALRTSGKANVGSSCN